MRPSFLSSSARPPPPPPLTERADSAPRRSSSVAGGGGGGGPSASDQGGAAAAWPRPSLPPPPAPPLITTDPQQHQQRRPSRWLENAAYGTPSPGAAGGEAEFDESGRRQQQRWRGGGGDVERGQGTEEEEGDEDGDSYDDEEPYDDIYDDEEEEDDDDRRGRGRSSRRSRGRSLKAAAPPPDGDASPSPSPSSPSYDDDDDDDEEAANKRDTLARRPSHAAAAEEAAPSTPPPPPVVLRNSRGASLVPVRRSVAEAFLVPDGRTKYWPAFTLTATVMFVGFFAFMAGGYGAYLAQEQQRRLALAAAAANSTTTTPTPPAPPPLLPDAPQPAWWATPRNMGQWLAFWRPTPQTTFAWPYLAAWGGRYAPALLKRQGGWRIVASLGLHASAAHLASNLLVFLLLSAHLEHSYGPLRVGLAFFAACIGGTFFSLAFEDPCALYVGASGGVYGLVGLYVLSIAVNHETMPLWWLRLGAMAASICFMIVVATVPGPGAAPEGGGGAAEAAATTTAAAPPPARNGTSHLSHLGGFLTGLLAAFLFLPNFKDRRWRAARRVAKRLGRALPGIKGSGSGNGGGGGVDGSGNGGGGLFAAAAPSCWRVRRPLFHAVAGLSVSSVVFLFVGLPIYAWTALLPRLSCPDEDALLASIDAPGPAR